MPRVGGDNGTLSVDESAIVDIGNPAAAGIGVSAADPTGSDAGEPRLDDAGDSTAVELETVNPSPVERDAGDGRICDGAEMSCVGMLRNKGAASETVCGGAKGSSPDF
jgi:hypothetical protein